MESVGSVIYLMGNFNPAAFQPAWLFQNGVEDSSISNSPSNVSITDDSAEFHIATTSYKVNRTVFQITDNSITTDELVGKLSGIFKTLLPFTPASALNIQKYIHFELNDYSHWKGINNQLMPKCPWLKFGEDSGLNTLKTYSTELLDKCVLKKYVTIERSQYFSNSVGAYVSTEFYYQYNQFQPIQDLVSLIEKEILKRFKEADEVFKIVMEIR